MAQRGQADLRDGLLGRAELRHRPGHRTGGDREQCRRSAAPAAHRARHQRTATGVQGHRRHRNRDEQGHGAQDHPHDRETGPLGQHAAEHRTAGHADRRGRARQDRPASAYVEGRGQADQIRQDDRVDGVPQDLAGRERAEVPGRRAEHDARRDDHGAQTDRHRPSEPGAQRPGTHDAEQTGAERGGEHRADGDLGEPDLIHADAAADPPQRVLRHRPDEHAARQHQARAAVRQPSRRGDDRTGRDRAAEPGGGRPDEQRDQGDRRERQPVAAAQVRDRQIEGARGRRDAQQPQGRRPVRITLGGDARRGHRRRRTGAEASDHGTQDHQRHGTRERGAAVPQHGQHQPDPRRSARPVRLDAARQAEAGRGRTQQQGAADQTGLGRAETQIDGEPSHDGGEQIGGEVTGGEHGNQRPRGARARGHGRS